MVKFAACLDNKNFLARGHVFPRQNEKKSQTIVL